MDNTIFGQLSWTSMSGANSLSMAVSEANKP